VSQPRLDPDREAYVRQWLGVGPRPHLRQPVEHHVEYQENEKTHAHLQPREPEPDPVDDGRHYFKLEIDTMYRRGDRSLCVALPSDFRGSILIVHPKRWTQCRIAVKRHFQELLDSKAIRMGEVGREYEDEVYVYTDRKVEFGIIGLDDIDAPKLWTRVTSLALRCKSMT